MALSHYTGPLSGHFSNNFRAKVSVFAGVETPVKQNVFGMGGHFIADLVGFYQIQATDYVKITHS